MEILQVPFLIFELNSVEEIWTVRYRLISENGFLFLEALPMVGSTNRRLKIKTFFSQFCVFSLQKLMKPKFTVFPE
jgi:hypothetical protein